MNSFRHKENKPKVGDRLLHTNMHDLPIHSPLISKRWRLAEANLTAAAQQHQLLLWLQREFGIMMPADGDGGWREGDDDDDDDGVTTYCYVLSN